MAWLYVPELECSTKDSAPDSLSAASITTPSVTWKGKPMPQAFWLRAWKTASWIKRLSGTTYSHSTANLGVASWIASLQAFHANHTASLESGRDSPTNAGFGPTSHAPFVRLDPKSFGWRTSPDSPLLVDLLNASEIFPYSGMMHNGACWQLPTLAHATNEVGSLFLHINPNCAFTGIKWPTPRARDYHSTPTKPRLDNLPDFAKYHFSRLAPPLIGQQSAPNSHSSPPKLNPAFVCWLMGWPWWWTNPEPTNSAQLEMASFQHKLQSHLYYSLNVQA